MDQRELTKDTIAEESLAIWQHADGYRFGLDAVLLATDLPEFDETGRIVELGAAQGVVALCIASRHPDAEVVAVERQDSLYELLERNVEENGLADRVEPRHADIREFRDLFEPHSADLVVCNPPYFRAGERRTSDDAQRAAARHELEGTLTDFVRAAQYVLDQQGSLKLIVPPLRVGDLYDAADQTDLSFVSMRYFHSREGDDAYLAECVLRRGGAPDIRVRSPLFVYDGSEYCNEVRERIDHAAT